MLKDIDLLTTTEETDEEESTDGEIKSDSVAQFVDELFSIIYMKRKLTGCVYLKDALILCCASPYSAHKQLTTTLYPAVATLHCTTGSRVERAIRSAIKDCFDHGNMLALNSVFGCHVVDESYTPTNGEFISAVSEKIYFRLKCNGGLQK